MTEAEELVEFAALALARAVKDAVRNGRRPPRMALELAAFLHAAAVGGTARQKVDRRAGCAHDGPMDALLLTTVDVARLLRVSVRTVRSMSADGRLEPVRIGGAVRYRRADVEALVASGPRSFRDVVTAKDTTPSARVGRGPSRSADPIKQSGAA